MAPLRECTPTWACTNSGTRNALRSPTKAWNVHTHKQPDATQRDAWNCNGAHKTYEDLLRVQWQKALYTVPTLVEVETHKTQGTDAQPTQTFVTTTVKILLLIRHCPLHKQVTYAEAHLSLSSRHEDIATSAHFPSVCFQEWTIFWEGEGLYAMLAYTVLQALQPQDSQCSRKY